MCISTSQPQFSSTPALVGVGGAPAVTGGYLGLGGRGRGVTGGYVWSEGGELGHRQVLGSLASQENAKQQVRRG